MVKILFHTIPWPKVPLSLPGPKRECGNFGPGMMKNRIRNMEIKMTTPEHMFGTIAFGSGGNLHALDWPTLYLPCCVIYYLRPLFKDSVKSQKLNLIHYKIVNDDFLWLFIFRDKSSMPFLYKTIYLLIRTNLRRTFDYFQKFLLLFVAPSILVSFLDTKTSKINTWITKNMMCT